MSFWPEPRLTDSMAASHRSWEREAHHQHHLETFRAQAAGADALGHAGALLGIFLRAIRTSLLFNALLNCDDLGSRTEKKPVTQD